MYLASFNMTCQNNHSTHLPGTSCLFTVPKPNMQRKMKHLYCARALYPTILIPLNDIATEKTKATEKTYAATNQLLDYLAIHPNATIIYHASDMILHIHSDASYLSVSHARSRLGGLFFCGDNSPKEDNLNGSILDVAPVIKNVVASEAESEVGACFQNSQSGAPLRVTIADLALYRVFN
jgi:hypothetical protein